MNRPQKIAVGVVVVVFIPLILAAGLITDYLELKLGAPGWLVVLVWIALIYAGAHVIGSVVSGVVNRLNNRKMSKNNK